jgi:dihydroxy-acid dehydratase
MYTANTMASAIEALGMSLPNSSAQDAISTDKNNDCVRAGEAVLTLLEKDIHKSLDQEWQFFQYFPVQSH